MWIKLISQLTARLRSSTSLIVRRTLLKLISKCVQKITFRKSPTLLKNNLPPFYDTLSDSDFYLVFRFERNDITKLMTALKLPTMIISSRYYRCTSRVALLLLLFRLAYPGRLVAVSSCFRFSRCKASSLIHTLLALIITKWKGLLTSIKKPMLTSERIDL